MIFQVILISGLLLITAYAVMQRARSPIVALGVLGASLSGIIFTAAPELANYAAWAVGISRGADLILYCFVLIALAAILNLHLRLRQQHEMLTEVVRQIAILSAPSLGLSTGVRAGTPEYGQECRKPIDG
jgi:small membrane protein